MTKKKIFTIAGIAVGAVIVIGIEIWLIFFRGGSVAPSDPNEMVYVTSVADITGTGSLGMTAKYSGVVEPEKTLSVQKDDTKKIAELYVTVGQEVKVGDKLFSYDTDDLQMQLQATTTTINGETVLSTGISGFGIRIQNAADHSLVAVGNSSWLPFNINTQPDFEAVPVKQSGVELMASEFNATMTMVVDYQ